MKRSTERTVIFLTLLVSIAIAFPGDVSSRTSGGKVSMFLGGYSDFLNHQSAQKEINRPKKRTSNIKVSKTNNKLSFKFKFELENIPNEIEKKEKEISLIKNELKDNNLYISNPDRFEEITKKLNILEKEFEEKEQRWLDLLEMEEAVKKENE